MSRVDRDGGAAGHHGRGLSADGRVAALAGRQRGVIRADQLRTLGLDKHAIHRRVRKGTLRRLHPGVFAVGPPALIPLARELAALYACGRGSRLCRHSGAVRWELLQHQAGRPVDVLLPAGRRRGSFPGVTVHSTRVVLPDPSIRDGLPVTDVPRTILDLAEELPTASLEALVARAERRGLITPDALRAISRATGRRGGPALRTVLDRQTAFTRSEAERKLLAVIRAAGLPMPRTNVIAYGYEVDCHWPAHRLVVEVDGWEFHGSRRSFEGDHRRDAALAGRGLLVRRFTARQVSDGPYRVVARIAADLAVRLPRSA